MKILDGIILNVVLVLFPILVYFIYGCYNSLKGIKYNKMVFLVMLLSSLYLVFRYGDMTSKVLLFCNVPLVVAYLKKNGIGGIILSSIIIFNGYYQFGMNIWLLIVKYSIYFMIYLYVKKNKHSNDALISAIALLQGFFIGFEYFCFEGMSDFKDIVFLFIIVLVFYLVPFMILYLFRLGDNISNLYLNVVNIEKDKQFKNSLFKVTHEVKNPIAVCKGYLDMMDVSDVDKTMRYVGIIKQEIDRSLNLMSDFMEFSKIKLDMEELDINMLLDDVSDEMVLFQNKKVKINYIYNDDEIYVMGDYDRLKQVLINLVKNSIEAITEKGLITIRSFRNKDRFVIEVADNGKGMDEETVARVKEMFFTTKSKGSGLGVSLSCEIIKGHKGDINYESKIGKGTKVFVSLPILDK